MLTAQKAGGVFRNPNILCGFLCTGIFFGLIIAANIKMIHSPPAKVRRLSVKYRGDENIGNNLIKKGRKFLTQKGYINMNDQAMLKELHSFFRKKPEVQHIYYAKKIFPDTVEIKLALREPFVKVGKIYFDSEGYRLPAGFCRTVRGKSIPSISGISIPKTLGPGEMWENIYFQETLQALRTVQNTVSITGVLVPGSRGGMFANGIVLATKEGTYIYWGKVFHEGMGQGVSTEMKLKNLEKALHIITRNMDKVKYVDVSRKRPVIKYKLEVS